jgi:hypothetical protein
MIDRIDAQNEHVFLVFLFILLLIGLVRQWERERLTLFLKSFINSNLIDTQLRQERAFSRLAIFNFTIVVLVLSTFLALMFHQFHYFTDLSFIGLTAGLFIGLILLTTARVALYAFLSWLFNMESLQQYHTFHWLLTNSIQAIFLLPISILLAFGPSEMKEATAIAGLSALGIFYLFRVLRLSMLAGFDFRVPLTYNFLYICALEILPVVAIITVISRQFEG